MIRMHNLRYKFECFKRDLGELRDDLSSWTKFIIGYTKRVIVFGAEYFEGVKDILVKLLMAKRGRYTRPFLNLSVFLLVGAGFIVAPIIKQSHPLLGGNPAGEEFTAPSAVLTSISAEQIPTSTKISEKPRDRVVEHTVEKGETLSEIAERYGVSEDTIRWANNIKKENPVLQIGEKLKIPPVTGVVHTVRKGETVYSIAKKYSAEPQNIVNWPFNEFSDLETFALETGQTLIVPGGVVKGEGKAPAEKVVPQRRIIAGGGGRFLWPAGGRITQYFVWYHKALDIANKSAPEVAAADGGTIVYAGCSRWGYGCHVRIDNGNGFETLYAHLSRYYVEIGDKVARGEAIGRMGSTGRSTGTHLHFEIRKNGVLVNPLQFLQ